MTRVMSLSLFCLIGRIEAQAAADKEAQEIYQKAENKKAVLRAKAESRCAAAAKLIAERIVNG